MSNINKVPADGTYWAVEFPAWTFPCHFNPPAKDLEHVRRHYPQAGAGSMKITGVQFLRLADDLGTSVMHRDARAAA